MNRNLMTLLLAIALSTLTGCWTFDKEWRGGQVRPYDDSGDDDDTATDSDDDDSVGDDDDSVGDDDDDDSSPEPDPEPCQDEEFVLLDGPFAEACSYPVITDLGGDTYVASNQNTVDLDVTFEVEGPVVQMTGFLLEAHSTTGPDWWMEDALGFVSTVGPFASISNPTAPAWCDADMCSWAFISQDFVDAVIEQAGEEVPEDEMEYWELGAELMEAFIGSFTGGFDNLVIYSPGETTLNLDLALVGSVPQGAELEWEISELGWLDGAEYEDLETDKIFWTYDDATEADMLGMDRSRTVSFEGDAGSTGTDVGDVMFNYNPPGSSATVSCSGRIVAPNGNWLVDWGSTWFTRTNVDNFAVGGASFAPFLDLEEGTTITFNCSVSSSPFGWLSQTGTAGWAGLLDIEWDGVDQVECRYGADVRVVLGATGC